MSYGTSPSAINPVESQPALTSDIDGWIHTAEPTGADSKELEQVGATHEGEIDKRRDVDVEARTDPKEVVPAEGAGQILKGSGGKHLPEIRLPAYLRIDIPDGVNPLFPNVDPEILRLSGRIVQIAASFDVETIEFSGLRNLPDYTGDIDWFDSDQGLPIPTSIKHFPHYDHDPAWYPTNILNTRRC